MRPILGSIGVGYDPGRGYAWGDLGKGKDWKERTLDMAPLPPITTQIAREGVGKVLTTANVLGVNAYTESQYDKIDRQVKNDPTYGLGQDGLDWAKSTAAEFAAKAAQDPAVVALAKEYAFYFGPGAT